MIINFIKENTAELILLATLAYAIKLTLNRGKSEKFIEILTLINTELVKENAETRKRLLDTSMLVSHLVSALDEFDDDEEDDEEDFLKEDDDRAA